MYYTDIIIYSTWFEFRNLKLSRIHSINSLGSYKFENKRYEIFVSFQIACKSDSVVCNI